MTREFIRLPNFEACWKKCGLSEDAVRELEFFLCSNPKAGVPIKGTGGLRKLRRQLEHTGKSGGARVIYIDFERYEKIYLISAYTKGEKEDLSDSEKKTIKKIINQLENELRKK